MADSINRFAEAMTLFAVACAGLFPLLHLGRPWLFYWLLPYPNTMDLWPQWRSPLVWMSSRSRPTRRSHSCSGMSACFPTWRPCATGQEQFARLIYGVLAMGWRGSAHWHRYQTAYLLLAGLATPLVVSVHSVVSLDFAVGIVPGWHSTIFPPYFVAGAIFSGFAMVLTLAIPLRSAFGLQDFITARHLDNMAKVMLATGLIVAYGYLMEAFIAWYGQNPFEHYTTLQNRPFGPYAHTYWIMMTCNVLVPQLLWFPWVRSQVVLLWILSILVNVGMWLERYVIVVTSLSRDFVPSAWGMYHGTLGLRNPVRVDRSVRGALVLVYPVPACHLDGRDA